MSHKSFTPQNSMETTASTSPTPKEIKALKKEIPPGFIVEVTWLTVSLFLIKISTA